MKSLLRLSLLFWTVYFLLADVSFLVDLFYTRVLVLYPGSGCHEVYCFELCWSREHGTSFLHVWVSLELWLYLYTVSIFSFCLCPRNYSGLFPNKAKECQCVLQQRFSFFFNLISVDFRGRKVIESIPHAAFSASCVNFYTPAKCMNAKFNVVVSTFPQGSEPLIARIQKDFIV